MDIEYKVNKKYSRYDYLTYIVNHKKKIKEKPMTKVRSFTIDLLLKAPLIVIVYIIGGWIIYQITNNIEVVNIVYEATLLYIILVLLNFLYIYLNYKKQTNGMLPNEGIIRINEKGITDISEDGSLFFPYEKIEFILLFNDYAFIIHKNSILNMALMNYDKKKLLEALNKYNKDLLVIQQSTRR